ncbi:hypothetical protein MVEN_00303400 [Mycena venus]|uniref:Ricin B lectin domain-containing protein n=1 Tax=Mycena venus TaxID=2733690 RepID=A0A8H6Z2G3_9AGAR|nr:hypothetical protein MVEN_00303400 [Mycena venus]
MISFTLFALVGFSLSVVADQIQSTNPAFSNAGIQGCLAVADNADGEPLVIHNCNNGPFPNQDWQVSFWIPTEEDGPARNSAPQQIKVFGDKCIDVKDGVNADGTKLQIWTCADGNKNQEWVSVTDSTFQWNGTNKCIDLTDGKITEGNVLQIYTCDSKNSNQKWIGEAGPEEVDIVNLLTSGFAGGRAWCIAAASDTDGAEVALVECLGDSDFHTIFPTGNITWSIPFLPIAGQFRTFNNKCLDVPNGSTANGVKLQLWTCAAGNTNQLFQMQSETSQIQWNGKGKCLDLTDGKSANGTPIQLWDCAVPADSNPNQLWFH